MEKNKSFHQSSFFIPLVTILLSLAAGATGGYFAVQYAGVGQKGKVAIEKETIKKAEYAPQTTHEERIINVVEKAQNGVVSVIASKDVPVFEQYFRSPFGNDPFFKQFFPDFQIPDRKQKGTEKKQISAGTGFVISDDGLILTNKHVVSDEEAEYTVISNKGDKYPAKVLARDPAQDLAVLKIDQPKTGELPQLLLGNSDTLKAGQSVVAIGNALGEFQNTVSVGVISGLRRTIVASSGFGESETLEEVIQTDTAINPGNSGGPLLNLSGEVIGVNVAMAQGAENIGFAILINRAKKDIEDVKTKGKITYPFLGVRYILVSQELKEKNKLPVDYGALVVRGETVTDLAVVPGSAADKAGIAENDIILEIDGQKITQDNTPTKVIQQHSVGDTITLKFLHKGEEKSAQAVLGER